MTPRTFVIEDVSYKCPRCGEVFATLSSYRKHLDITDAEKSERTEALSGRIVMSLRDSYYTICGRVVSVKPCYGTVTVRGIRVSHAPMDDSGEYVRNMRVAVEDVPCIPVGELTEADMGDFESRFHDRVRKRAYEILDDYLPSDTADSDEGSESYDGIDVMPEVQRTPTYYCANCCKAFSDMESCAAHSRRCRDRPVLDDDSKAGFRAATGEGAVYGRMHKRSGGKGYYGYAVIVSSGQGYVKVRGSKDIIPYTPRFDSRQEIRREAMEDIMCRCDNLLHNFIGEVRA